MAQSVVSLDQNANRVNDSKCAVRFFNVVLADQTDLGAGTLNDASVDLGAPSVVSLLLEVTAINGSPTLDVDLETSSDNSAWETVDSFAQLTSVDSTRVRGVVDRYIRVTAVVAGTGTPKFTFTIKGEAK